MLLVGMIATFEVHLRYRAFQAIDIIPEKSEEAKANASNIELMPSQTQTRRGNTFLSVQYILLSQIYSNSFKITSTTSLF